MVGEPGEVRWCSIEFAPVGFKNIKLLGEDYACEMYTSPTPLFPLSAAAGRSKAAILLLLLLLLLAHCYVCCWGDVFLPGFMIYSKTCFKQPLSHLSS